MNILIDETNPRQCSLQLAYGEATLLLEVCQQEAADVAEYLPPGFNLRLADCAPVLLRALFDEQSWGAEAEKNFPFGLFHLPLLAQGCEMHASRLYGDAHATERLWLRRASGSLLRAFWYAWERLQEANNG